MSPMETLDFEEVRRFCASRPVELAIVGGRGRADALVLHADFEGNADFFAVEVQDVEYVEMPGRCWVGGLHLGPWDDVATCTTKWSTRRAQYSGSALVFWDADAGVLAKAPEEARHVVVAGRFTFTRGRDWMQPSAQ